MNVDARSVEDDGKLDFYPPGCSWDALVLEEWHVQYARMAEGGKLEERRWELKEEGAA